MSIISAIARHVSSVPPHLQHEAAKSVADRLDHTSDGVKNIVSEALQTIVAAERVSEAAPRVGWDTGAVLGTYINQLTHRSGELEKALYQGGHADQGRKLVELREAIQAANPREMVDPNAYAARLSDAAEGALVAINF